MRKPVAIARVKVIDMLSALYGKNIKSIRYRVEKKQEIKPGEVVDIDIDGKCLADNIHIEDKVIQVALGWLFGLESKSVKVSVYKDVDGVYMHEFVLDGHDVVIKLERVVE